MKRVIATAPRYSCGYNCYYNVPLLLILSEHSSGSFADDLFKSEQFQYCCICVQVTAESLF